METFGAGVSVTLQKDVKMRADLLLIIHFHQPVGNFEHVMKRVHDNCYKPFLDIISRYPDLKMSMHFSGCLLEWFKKNTPDIFDTIGKLVKRGQVEIIGGGFYEPVLSIIPEADRIGQISMMRRYIKSHFGVEPKGAWIAERVWEPELVSHLAKAGVEYIVLDDMHFLYTGMKKEETYGYFISEDNGSSVRIFPSDKELRYIIPFSEPDKPISYMRQIAENKENVIFTYGDDAEKFGEWPGTYKWVYDDRWLVRFLDNLSKNSSWLITRTVSECIKDNKPSGRAYLPAASYEEMLEWALPADASRELHEIKEEIKRENKYERYSPFIRGGFFRNFLAKYDESNQMHKRMLYISNLLKAAGGVSDGKLKEAYTELYKGQCNCSYWHGVFGGIYLYHLRKAIYEHLIKAENIYEKITGMAGTQGETIDFDLDGFDEAILHNKDMWLCVKPSAGGTIVEMDVKNRAVNILNVLTRRKEAYHKDIIAKKEEAIDEHVSIHDKPKEADGITTGLIYDIYRKSMFIDHFFGEDTTPESFEGMEYSGCGDFAGSIYEFKMNNDKNKPGVVMKREGVVGDMPVRIRKEIVLNGATLNISYNIINLGKAKKKIWFGTEMAFIMPDADSSRYAYILGLGRKKEKDMTLLSRGTNERLEKLEVRDSGGELGFFASFSKECTLWRFPIKTVSQSEKAYEENYQGSVIVPNWHFSIEPHKSADFNIKLEIKT